MKDDKQMRWTLPFPQLTALREYAGHGTRKENRHGTWGLGDHGR